MLFRAAVLTSLVLVALGCSSSEPPGDAPQAGKGGSGGAGASQGGSSAGSSGANSSGGTASGSGAGGTGVAGTSSAGTAGSAGSTGGGGFGTGGAAAGTSGTGGAQAGAGAEGGTAGVSAGGSAGNGVGGTSAGAGGGSGAGGSGQPGGCGTAVICDDFEGGMDPAWMVQQNSVPAPLVNASKGANGSSSSLEIEGTSSQAFVAVPVPGQAFYVRAHMQFEQSTEQMNGHGWFIVAADNLTQGDADQMRFGSSSNHGHKEIDFNVYGDNCSGEKTQFSDGASDGASGWENTPYDSVQFAANEWYCVEAYFNGPGHEFQLWIDGVEVPGLHVTEASMCTGWSPTYTHIKFGAGANSSIGKIWYDDVGVSTTRIGCP